MKKTLTFDIPTDQRKALARHIGDYFQEHAQYKMPGFRYVIDGKAEVLRDASVVLDDSVTEDERSGLLNYLLDQGFNLAESNEIEEAEPIEESSEETNTADDAEDQNDDVNEAVEAAPEDEGNADNSENEEPTVLNISLPDDLTDAEFERLQAALDSKKTLIQHALQNDGITLKREDGKISFEGFPAVDSDHYKAYADFAAAITKFAKEAIRVSSAEKDAVSEKYAFRCFLLRLGMIGPEYKLTRKILLENLSGSSAFKTNEQAKEHSAKWTEKKKEARMAETTTASETDQEVNANADA